MFQRDQKLAVTAKWAHVRANLGVVLLLSLSSSQSGLAQDGRLNVDLAGTTPRVRANAPVMLLLKAYWNGSSIAEGHFQVDYYSDGHMLRSETTSHEIVLTPGEQTIRLILPAAGSNISFGQDEVHLKFISKDETFDLNRYPLMSSRGERTMNVCVIGPTDRGPSTAAEDEITDSLRLGDLLVPDVVPGSVSTLFTRWDVADVPEQALQFCSFDLVLLRPEGLMDLRKKQMDGLLAWVRAGGSIAVLLPQELDGNQVGFLNQLVSESFQSPFSLDTNGRFIADENTSTDGMWSANIELGRAAIYDLAQVPTDADLRWRKSRSVSGFLWKMRWEQRKSLAHFSQRYLERIQKQNRGAAPRGGNQPLAWQPLRSVGRFVSELMPEDVRVVPMFLIALLLLGYLILIGPIDYYVLGYLKRRRYTWLTFPLMTALVAYLCVALSESYLASETTGKSLVIRDMGADGTVLRETKFELKFLGRRAEQITELSNELFSALDSDRLMLGTQYAYRYQYMGQTDATRSRPTQYVGRIPSKYMVRQEIAQWQPQVNRSFAIAPGKKEDGFAWNDTTWIEPSHQERLRQAILARWPASKAVLFRKNEKRDIAGDGKMFRPPPISDDARYRLWYQEEAQAGAFCDDLCRRPDTGFFGLVSQLAPNGGDNFEDLTLLDTSDRGQAVLVIAVHEGDSLVMYRRFYTGLNEKR